MEKENTIQDVIKERMKLPDEVKGFIKINIFFNFIMAIIMLSSTLMVNITYSRFSSEIFEGYIHIFQLVLAVITIIFFETAYKKDSFLISFYGIEMFIFSLSVMFVPYFYILKGKLNSLIFITMLFTVYYIFKSIFTGLHIRNNYLKNNISDVKEIVKDHKESYIDEKSTKTLRENKKAKQEKQSKENKENNKDNKDNDDSKEQKDNKGNKDSKEHKENKTNKENKDSKANKENKTNKENKDSKANKEDKDNTKNKNENVQNNKTNKQYTTEKLNENLNKLKKMKENEKKSK